MFPPFRAPRRVATIVLPGALAVALAGTGAPARLPSPAVADGGPPSVVDQRLYTAPQLRRNAALVVFRTDRPLAQRPRGGYRARVVVDGQPAPVFAIAGERQRPCYAAYLYGNDRDHPVRFRPGSSYRVRIVADGRTRSDASRRLGGQPETALEGGPIDC